jgi:8-oxo-dGTP pyrophosphatase MutT (NUDIX family)
LTAPRASSKEPPASAAIMTDPRIYELDRVEAVLEQRDWAFARERAGDIAAHWEGLAAANPHLFDGRVLVQHARRIEGRVMHARYLETSFAAFIAWRDFGWPDLAMRNGFAMAALRAADGAFLLGRMAGHTANAGKVYFPAGTPDPSDLTADGRVDLDGSALRELVEETGLAPGEVTVGSGWTTIEAGTRIAFMREMSLPMGAARARALILSRLAAQERPEFSDIVIVRQPADIDAGAMPDFTCAYLAHALAAGGPARS